MIRVDTVSVLLRPFFLIYGWGFGFLVYVYTLFIRSTCRIRFEGTDLRTHPNYILCIWHDTLILYFTVFTDQRKQVWMNHPAWYMKPVHVLLQLSGVKDICLGSSGNGGKEALEGVINYLRQGYSTTVACDGPAGPNHVLKKGVLYMSRDTGVPVIPIRFKYNRFYRLGGWDRKFAVFPFSKLTVEAGAPVVVTESNIEVSEKTITDWLDFKAT